MTCGIVLFRSEDIARGDEYGAAHPLSDTMHRAPLVGSRRKAKSREGSHTSVSALGRYPPTDDVIFFVRCSDRRFKLDLGGMISRPIYSNRTGRTRRPRSSSYLRTPRTRRLAHAFLPDCRSTPKDSRGTGRFWSRWPRRRFPTSVGRA